ncbi:ABC transporter substrate-binding protein [Pseudoroseomonas cervicalis]|uniref:ABC transporter, substrate-binding protein, family 5 n=1 Tax=Pseudoroseomonas cervicalis ATCC 49957 TaxID=525371 RepID=D5RGR8_9PROT|nr:ABC transporter substrate-binding protein [Pseudoroseomonas cervicalis]EFH13479.1 ABC transporter, substrate-binding protein, family 5 [Pseudoroseomonas cervicalis ATCC 49957]
MIANRRSLLLGAGGALGAAALPRFAIAQADNRPSITIAVQKVSNSNTLEVLREQSNVGERVLFSSLWEGLIGRDWLGGLKAVPELATSWRRLSDSAIEMTLRQGVKFHNGDEMTAEDVAFTFGPERMFGDTAPTAQGRTIQISGERIPTRAGRDLPPEVPAVARRSFPALERVEIVDRYTVRFHNATPDVTLEGRLSRYGAQIISKRGYIEAETWFDWARKPILTGPYKVAEFRPDQSLRLVAHDEYWGGRPPLKEIRFIEVPEVSARINMLRSGEVQFACDIPPDQIADIERDRRYEVQGGTILNHRLTCFDKNHPQLVDPRVRRAFTHAIDRQAIVESLWAGRTVVPKGLQWDYYGDMFVSDWDVPKYDPAEARRLLREANYKGDPIPYRLLNNYYTNQTPTAQILVEMWKQVGLNVQIEMKENWSQILSREPGRAVRDWSNSAPFNDPVSSIVNQHGPNGQQQQVGEWSNEEMNRLSVELETSTDRARRKQAFRRMLEICEREDPAYTVLHQNATFTAMRRGTPWKAAPAFAMEFRANNWKG